MGSGCAGGGYSDATIKSNTTPQQDAEQAKKVGAPAPAPETSAATYVQNEVDNRDPNNPLGFSVAPPAAAPDLTDAALKQRRASQALSLLAGRGRRQAFLGQGYGPSALGADTTKLG
jgi:hypothetical protein